MKLNKHFLTRGELNEAIRKAIELVFEEKHVSSEVFNEAKILIDKIKKDFNANYDIKSFKGNHKYLQGSLRHFIFGKPFTINYNVEWFDTKASYQSLNHKSTGAEIQLKNKVLVVNSIMVGNDFLLDTFEGSLYHEVMHRYQEYKSRKGLMTTKKGKFYDTVSSALNNKSGGIIDKFTLMLSSIGYVTFNEETSAYLQDLYGTLINGGLMNFDKVLSHSSAVNLYNKIADDLDTLESDPYNNYLLKALEKFKPKTLQWFIQKGDRFLDDFGRKIDQVSDKAKKDLINNHFGR